MIGPVVLGAALIYLAISVAVVRGAIRYARDSGKNTKRWGWGAALVMYLIPFWDWLPTVVTHQYYCATEAGFKIYKTPEQWKRENPGVMETLVDNNTSPPYAMPNWPRSPNRLFGKDIENINQRFGRAHISHITSPNEQELILHVWRFQNEVLDTNTGEVLASHVDFSSGNGNRGGEPPIKFWLQSSHCFNSAEHSTKFDAFISQIRGAAK